MEQWHGTVFQQGGEGFVACTEDQTPQAGVSVLALKDDAERVAILADPFAFDAADIADGEDRFFIAGAKRFQSRELIGHGNGRSGQCHDAVEFQRVLFGQRQRGESCAFRAA